MYQYIEWLKLQAVMLPSFNKDIESIIRTIDMDQFRAFEKKYKSVDKPLEQVKFFKINKHLKLNLKRAYTLGLHKAKSLNVLDLGTGFGYFPYICKFYGHQPMALDRDDNPIFNDVVNFFGIDRMIWEITPYQLLPNFGKRFDLLTAFSITFSKPKSNEAWGPEEWEFLLKDIANNVLTPAGKVYLVLNHTEDSAYNSQLFEFYKDFGARINGAKVSFNSMQKFHSPATYSAASPIN